MAEMEITTRIGCKVSCVYCPQRLLVRAYKKRSNETIMSLGTFKRCIGSIPRKVTIHFSGFCEPWLNSHCTQMLLYAHEKGHKIGIFTTLVGMNLSDVEMIETIPLKFFFIHLPTMEGYEKIDLDDKYLSILERIHCSDLEIKYHCHGTVHPAVGEIVGEKIHKHFTGTRARNIEVDGVFVPQKKRGFIGCRRALENNVLLPNGDVSLCCVDFGLKHIIGNLRSSDYRSLFQSREFRRVKSGLERESYDILCRYCESFAYNRNLAAEIHNYYLPWVLSLRNADDISDFLARVFCKAKKIIKTNP